MQPLMRLPQVDENMERAHNRDAVLREKFWFRRNVLGDPNKKLADLGCKCNGISQQTVAEAVHGVGIVDGMGTEDGDEDAFEEMTADEIMNGKVRVHVHVVSRSANDTEISLLLAVIPLPWPYPPDP